MKAKFSGDRNQCPGCLELFNSTAAFDKHRTGDFGKNRRCMQIDEMRAIGMDKNAAGYWVTAVNPMFGQKDFSMGNVTIKNEPIDIGIPADWHQRIIAEPGSNQAEEKN